MTRDVLPEGVVAIGHVTVEYEIIAIPQDGGFVFDYRTTCDWIESDEWIPTAAEAESEVRRKLGAR